MSKVFAKKFLLPLLALVVLLLVAFSISVTRFSPRDQPLTHAPDYSWVIGRLEYNPIEGGFWQVRFGNQGDAYNGVFILGNDRKIEGFKNGDLVKITGKIAEEQISIYQAGTLYNLESIDPYQ